MKSDLLNQLEPLLAKWLPSQRWCSSGETSPSSIRIVDSEFLVGSKQSISQRERALLWVLVQIDDHSIYQVPLGIADATQAVPLALSQEAAVLGVVDSDGRESLIYDGLVDSSLTHPLFGLITRGEFAVKTVRPMGAEQTNSSLVYDNDYVLKIFRRLYKGHNPDLEVTKKLTDVGFPNIAPVLAIWQRGEYDLAVCQPFLVDGTDGGKLAIASARDFLASRDEVIDPASAGGDFADEAERLGIATGEMHLALSENFPTQPFDSAELVKSLQLSATELPNDYQGRLTQLMDELSQVAPEDAGLAIRIHGDYHFGNTMRTANGWVIFDFEGEPLLSLEERTLPSSPLRDVAGMLRSFHYAAALAVFEQMPEDQEALFIQSQAWIDRNRQAFCDGYLKAVGIDSVLPRSKAALETILRGFEVKKAIYELAYEKGHRPTWVSIPQSAIDRLLR